jgi:hypothetical protein
VTDGVTNQFRTVVEFQLFHDVRAVGLDSAGTDHQLTGDFPIGVTLRQHLHNFPLADRQKIQQMDFVVVFAVEKIIHQFAGHRRRDVDMSFQRRLQRVNQLTGA